MTTSLSPTDRIVAQIERSESWLFGKLGWSSDFVKTSEHASWRGKVRCKYCKVQGWPGSVEENPLWWGKNHGPNCKWRELYLLKLRQGQYGITYYNSTTTNGSYFLNGNGGWSTI